MKITIEDRIRLLSCQPGTEFSVPGTDRNVRIFPAGISVGSASGEERRFFPIPLEGPVHPFTIESDWERRVIRVSGKALQGYFRFVIGTEGSDLVLLWEKIPGGLSVLSPYTLVHNIVYTDRFSQERLFLGNHKKKEGEFIRRRRDLTEILPLWFFMGGNVPVSSDPIGGGPSELLDRCRRAVAENNRNILEEIWTALYLAGCSSCFVPRLIDEEKQGIFPSDGTGSPLSILTEGRDVLRSMFFQEREEEYRFLPCLPPKLVSGKMTRIETKDSSRIDMEWTKHRMRRVCIEPGSDRLMILSFPFGAKEFRLRRGVADRGVRVQAGTPVMLQKEQPVWLDCFEK